MSRDSQPRQTLRRELRARRRALTPAARRRAGRAALAKLRRLPAYRAARAVAIYLPQDAEIDPTALLVNSAKGFYLPVLRGSRLQFAPATAMRLRRNRFGIPEPVGVRRERAAALDLVVTPLVGFDPAANRLGQGGGFYDRSFAGLRWRRRRPRLIGLAFACQGVANLPVARWDVPLDAVVTEAGVVWRRIRR